MMQWPLRRRLLSRKIVKSQQGRLRERMNQQQLVAGQDETHSLTILKSQFY
jgi:hypothetical protein